MPYLTPEDLKPLLAVGDITAVTWGEGPYPDESTIEALIARKSETLDALCRSLGYVVPFAPAPGPIADLVTMRCLAELLPKIHRDVPEQVQAARGYATDADKLQALLVNGLLSLDDGNSVSPVVPSAAVTRSRRGRPPFSMYDAD